MLVTQEGRGYCFFQCFFYIPYNKDKKGALKFKAYYMTGKQTGNPGKKYFEDVFNPIIVYWKKRYYFSKRNDTDSMVCSLGKHFNEIEYEVDVNNFGKYNDWQSAMVFIIYSVATDYALNLQKKPRSFLLSDIPVATFENKLIENFKSLHNDKQFHYKYEDFIVAYKGFSNKSLSRLNLGGYLKHFSLTLN